MDHRFSAALIMVLALAGVVAISVQAPTQATDPSTAPTTPKSATQPTTSGATEPRRDASSTERQPLSTGEMPDNGSQSSPAVPGSGIELLRRVVSTVGQYSAVSARVRHRTDLFGQQLVGQGHYLQRMNERGLQVSYLLTVKTNQRMVNLLQVCDGRYLWTRQNAEGMLKITRVDLPRLRRAGEGRPHDALPVMLGGGLPSLLASLQTNFIVSPPQEVTLQGIPMWALAFRWNPQRIRALASNQEIVDEQGRIRVDKLPEQLPDRVFLLVGQDDLFPYHLDFRRSNVAGTIGLEDRSPTQSLVTLEFFEVQFDVPIDDSRFVFKATGLKFVDETDAHIARLRRQFAR